MGLHAFHGNFHNTSISEEPLERKIIILDRGFTLIN